MSQNGKWILLGVFPLASLLIAAIIGVSILEFNQYRTSTVPLSSVPGLPQVHITSPKHNSQFSHGAPIIVEATAFSSSKIFSIELFLDGELIGVQSAPSGGSGYFSAEFLFFPPESGEHSLITRAIGIDQLTSYSPPLQIMVMPPELAAQAADPTESDSASITSPQLSPEDQTVAADHWYGTLGNWINSMTAASPPVAPELAATLDGCSVQLSIRDLSDNEEGFEVWRLLPHSPTWAKIAVLASQSQAEWITYTDIDAHGGTTYYVSSFNGKGRQDSNLVYVAVDPLDCAPPTPERSALTLTLESLEPHIPVDKLYCYVSPGGGLWMRRPEAGFWTPRHAAQGQGFFNVEILSMNLEGDGGLGSANNLRTIYLQCWGWLGDTLHYLGEIAPSLIPDQQGNYQLGSDGSIAKVALNLENYPSQFEFYPMDYDEDDGNELGVFDDQIYVLEQPLFKSIIDPTMPFVSSWITYSQEACKSHLPTNFFDKAGFCAAYPGFDLGWEGANPQPFLVWGPNQVPMCIAGSGSNCKSYEQLLAQAADDGHQLGFNIYDSNKLGFYIHQVTTPDLFSFVIPPVACSGSRTLWVQMWYYDGTTLQPTYGPPSGKSSIPCPYKLGQQMALDIRFDSLILSNVNDGQYEPQDIEIYGYLRASSETRTRYLNLATWYQQASLCPDDGYQPPFETGGPLGCPHQLTSGTHNLNNMTLCESNAYNNCSQSGWETNNNIIRLIITDQDSLTLSVRLIDWDDYFENDLVCQGNLQIPSKSIFDWHKVQNQPFSITSSGTESGSCQIIGAMNAVSPP